VSLILDALKKSERERQRDKAPGLQSIHLPLPPREVRSRKRWWLLAIALVAINGGLLGYWRLQQPVSAGAASAAVANAPTKSAAVVANSQVPQVASTSTNTSAAANSVADEYTNITPGQLGATESQAENNVRIEEVSELPDEVRNNLPAMTFSFHVYSSNAQQRTIIINNHRVREGDEVSSGITLQAITEDGVILLSAGHRIHIGVLSGW
jgi:general secretion pathway protein B